MLTYQVFTCANGGGQCAPVASFTATPTNGEAPLLVSFTDTSTGAITNRFWDFGDGSSTNTVLTSLAHVYNSIGTNTVALVVAGPGGVSTYARTNYIAVFSATYQTWQMQYFQCTDCPQAAATADPDGDGLGNLQEFLAGTDPTNSASLFGITGIVTEGDDLRLTWMTGLGKTNELERSAGDPSGNYTTNFTAIFTVTNTVGISTNYLDLGGATNEPSRYYRVRLVP
jgi:PKD repeat protein